MDIQRLRNLTTNYLHTEVEYLYKDLEMITGKKQVMTHELPNLSRSTRPWLSRFVTDERFWDNKYDPTHIGEFELPEPTEEDRQEMIKIYNQLPNPLSGWMD